MPTDPAFEAWRREERGRMDAAAKRLGLPDAGYESASMALVFGVAEDAFAAGRAAGLEEAATCADRYGASCDHSEGGNAACEVCVCAAEFDRLYGRHDENLGRAIRALTSAESEGEANAG